MNIQKNIKLFGMWQKIK